MERDFEMNKQDINKAVDDIMHFIGMASLFLDEEKCERAIKAAKILGLNRVNPPTEGDVHNALNSFSYMASQYLEMVNNDKDMEETINQDETTIRKFIIYHGAK